MLRFISHLFKLNYEPCHGCDILKWQLEQSNKEKKELLDVVLSIVKPKPIEVPETTTEVRQILPRAVTWTKQRQILEERDRVAARLQHNSPHMARPNENDIAAKEATEQLEREVKILEREVNSNVG